MRGHLYIWGSGITKFPCEFKIKRSSEPHYKSSWSRQCLVQETRTIHPNILASFCIQPFLSVSKLKLKLNSISHFVRCATVLIYFWRGCWNSVRKNPTNLNLFPKKLIRHGIKGAKKPRYPEESPWFPRIRDCLDPFDLWRTQSF